MNRALPALIAVAVLAAVGGYLTAMKFGPDTATPESTANVSAATLMGERRPDFTHRDPAGNPVSAADFDGKVLLLNFWATWCTPCVEEMPMLSNLQKRYAGRGLRVAGIALDDPGRAADFASGLDLAYPVLLGNADVVVTGRRYGNDSGLLPFTVLVDAEGIVRWTHLGALEAETLERQVLALLAAD